VELFAPGNLVYTTYNDGSYRLIGGTSIAAPHVAAAIALYKGVLPDASAAELKTALLADVQPVPAFAGRSVTGGRLSLVELGNSAAQVQYSFSAMAGEPGEVSPTVAMSGDAGPGTYSARLLLGMEHDGEVMAVSGQAISVDGHDLSTDDSGEVVVPLGARDELGSVVLRPATTLDEGRYVLVAQLLRDGAALTVPHAAPLLVGQDAVAPAPSPGTPVQPGDGPGTSPAPGSPSPTPGAPAPGGDAPEDAAPPGDQPGGSDPAPETGGSPDPGHDEPAPGEDGAAPTPPTASPAPGSGTPRPAQPAPPVGGDLDPRADEPGDQQPGDQDPGDQQPPGDEPPVDDDSGEPSPDPDLGGEHEYPEVGPFGLTSISPARVSSAGGTLVTITGTALPEGALVRIGDTTAVPVRSLTPTRLTFTTPALVAGTYDVHVIAPDRVTVSRLDDALTFVDVERGEQPGTGTPEPGDDPGTGLPPDPEDGRETDDTPEQVVTGPGGQRLVSSALFRSLPRSVWDLDCSIACSGVPL
jgi:hypothetical protein